LTDNSEELIRRLQISASAVLDPLIPQGGDIALLDFPNHSNVGDSMIWLGEVEYLRRRRARAIYICDCDSYRPKDLERVIRPETTILLHGGGNFGSLWPRHHAFRLRVLRDFPDHSIVQLPQSIHFTSETETEKTGAAIERHNRYVLLTRDHGALSFARARFACRSQLCTDSAFFIGPLATRKDPEVDVIALSRTDHEKTFSMTGSTEPMNPGAKVRVVDWLGPPLHDRVRTRLLRDAGKLAGVIGSPGFAILWPLWNAVARANLARGRRLLCEGKVVITDRLHAHIMCILLGKRHVMLDNSYGKLSSFHATWTKDSEITQVADSWSAAIYEARKLINPRQQQ
jgi:exopolysaccharide biosynthesis predicted pyruvyltransferase EpsI